MIKAKIKVDRLRERTSFVFFLFTLYLHFLALNYRRTPNLTTSWSCPTDYCPESYISCSAPIGWIPNGLFLDDVAMEVCFLVLDSLLCGCVFFLMSLSFILLSPSHKQHLTTRRGRGGWLLSSIPPSLSLVELRRQRVLEQTVQLEMEGFMSLLWTR